MRERRCMKAANRAALFMPPLRPFGEGGAKATSNRVGYPTRPGASLLDPFLRGRDLRRGAVLDRHALVPEQVLQLARLEHLADNVAAADELALHIELWERRPFCIGLDALAQVVAVQHIDVLIGHGDVIEDVDHLAREAAVWA